MVFDGKISAIIFLAVGLYLIFGGFTAEYLVDESEGTVSEDRKEKSKATPLTRTIVVTAGISAASLAIYNLLR